MGNDKKKFSFKIDKDRIKLQLKELSNKLVKRKSGKRFIVMVITFCLLAGVGLAIYFNYDFGSPLEQVERQSEEEMETADTIRITESMDSDARSGDEVEEEVRETAAHREREQQNRQQEKEEGTEDEEEPEIEGVVTEPLRDISEVASVARPQIDLLKPVSGQIIGHPGWYFHQVFKDWRYRSGIIMGGNTGDIVMAAEKGEVTAVGSDPYLGIMVTVNHENGWSTVYGHLQRAAVSSGEMVAKGQEVGRIGSSGFAEESSLYFELKNDDQSVDPAQYF